MKEAYRKTVSGLASLYDERETGNIANMLMEKITGFNRIDRLMHESDMLSVLQIEQWENNMQQLLIHIPIQYVLKEAWFAGMPFYVDENVLIPRQETEELVEWIYEELKIENEELKIKNLLDVGTGSGCISIVLKKKIATLDVVAIDVSESALNVAKKNASSLQAEIAFEQIDFLDEQSWDKLGVFDVIVSNPPYIRMSEAGTMSSNVLEHEPHLALFVADEDALLFYRKIAEFGKMHLNNKGKIFLEINETFGNQVASLFQNNGYKTELRKDMQGKDRMLKAERVPC